MKQYVIHKESKLDAWVKKHPWIMIALAALLSYAMALITQPK